VKLVSTVRSAFRAPRPHPVRFAIVYAGSLALYIVSSQFGVITHATHVNNFVVLADAFLHGRLWVSTAPLYWVDCVMHAGKCYVIEGPMPAVLMLPVVALFGLNTNQSLVCVLIAAAGVAGADMLLGRMNVGATVRALIVALFGFGTVFWWCAVNPNVWMFAHVVCATLVIYALAEWYGARRLWVVGLLLGCAALTRSPLALAAIPFLYWASSEAGWRGARSFLAGFAPCIILEVAYNLARWHVPYDIGYTTWYHQDQAGSPTGYPLALRYLPYNLYSFFFLAPSFNDGPPWLTLGYQGVAITLTTPALALALAAPRSRETFVLWVTAVLVAVPDLLYYVNGYAQFGMRHSLDFTPFLICLAARGFERRQDALGWWLVAYSVAANAFGVAYYRT